MPRSILDEQHIHAAIRQRVAGNHASIVDEVQRALAANQVVVVGMGGNPMSRKGRKALDAQGLPYAYLQFGGYFSQWRRRNALKMWTGWPTFPMIFIDGVLVGGADDLEALIANGEFARLTGKV